MKKIGFKNFRRFKEFAPLELGEITFLVGRNNSGKSTLVKAVLLLIDYLSKNRPNEFAFDGDHLEEVNVASFGRTLYNKAEADVIHFSFSFLEFDCYISISGDKFSSKASVFKLHITDKQDGFEFEITNGVIVNITRDAPEQPIVNQNLLEASEDLGKLKAELKDKNNSLSFEEATKLKTLIKTQEKKIKSFKEVDTPINRKYSFSIGIGEGEKVSEPLEEIIDLAMQVGKSDYRKINVLPSVIKPLAQAFLEDESLIRKKIKKFTEYTNKLHVVYFGADSHKGTALFSLKDKNNSLAQAIHQFAQLRLSSDDKAYEFVETWMDKFEVGDTFEIESFEGEAYRLHIFKNDPNKEFPINISDKGMGSLQAMKLILQVATVIHSVLKRTGIDQNNILFVDEPEHNLHPVLQSQHSDFLDKKKNNLIIVEEPELNLHPALQSLLADFFYEVNKEYGIRFIIETHSEYIIRSTQVIGLKNELFKDDELNQNPFKVYYFHLTEGPYEMNYTSEGKFDKNFASGFTNVATDSTKKILKLNRK